MDDLPLGFLMAFLLPFHLGGGVALGVALRRIVQGGFKFSSLAGNGFLLLWGAVFGGLPLLFGLAAGPSWFVFLQLATFLGTIIVVAVGYEWLRDLYSQPAMFVATFGLFFLLIGTALTASLLSQGDTDGLLIGLIFAGIGGIITLAGGLWLLRSGSG
jgi:hypothetical protein